MGLRQRSPSRLLEEQLAEVRARLAGLDGLDGDDPARGRDDGDLAAAAHNHTLTADEHERLTLRERQLVEALERVADGTYGTCTECVGVIGPKRLEAIPWTETCLGCQAKREAAAARMPRVRPRWEEPEQ